MTKPADSRNSRSSNRTGNGRRSGNPAKRAAAAAPGNRSARPRGLPLLAWLHRQPRWLVPVATVLLTLGGMFLPSVAGGVCLLLVAGFLGWLASLAWPRLGTGARVGRVAIVLVVGAVAVARMTGLWVA